MLLIFHVFLVVALTISFFIHNTISESSILLVLYAINAFIAIAIYNAAYFFRKTQQDSLGYYFLAGTVIKFMVFFTYVLPQFMQDGEQTKQEFFSFFTPYIVALFIETISLLLLVKNNEINTVKN